MADLDSLYRERDELIAFIAALYPSWKIKLADDWTAIYINSPAGQLSWHVNENDLDLFDHVPIINEIWWDGHTPDEKHNRLRVLTRDVAKMKPHETSLSYTATNGI